MDDFSITLGSEFLWETPEVTISNFNQACDFKENWGVKDSDGNFLDEES